MTKQAVVAALAEILRQLNTLEDLGIKANRLAKLRREAIFFLYEGGGDHKWSEHRPHSAGARALMREVGSGLRSKGHALKLLTYEHAVPLATLASAMRAAATTDEGLERFLDTHVLGVVLLRAEDDLLRNAKLRQTMPTGSAPHDRMARYRAAGVVFEPHDQEKIEAGWSIHLTSPQP